MAKSPKEAAREAVVLASKFIESLSSMDSNTLERTRRGIETNACGKMHPDYDFWKLVMLVPELMRSRLES